MPTRADVMPSAREHRLTFVIVGIAGVNTFARCVIHIIITTAACAFPIQQGYNKLHNVLLE